MTSLSCKTFCYWSRWKTLASRSFSTGGIFPVIPASPSPAAVARHRDQHLAVCAAVVRQREEIFSLARSREGGAKKTARQRVSMLADEGAEVLEVGLLAGLALPYGDIPSAGNVVAITQVCGQTCVVSANDWTVKGGCSYPITVKKQLRAQEIAFQNFLPCIYLVDSGGGYLPLQVSVTWIHMCVPPMCVPPMCVFHSHLL